jgi:hypothetical protein
MSARRPDAIALILKKISEIAPEISGEQMQLIEHAIRRELGGSRHYFAKAPAARNAALLNEQLLRGIPIDQAAKKIGCTARHARRLVSED